MSDGATDKGTMSTKGAGPGAGAAERVHVTRSRARPGGTAVAADGAVPFRRAEARAGSR